MLFICILRYINLNKTDMTEAHLKNAYDRLRELNIGYDEKYILIKIMSTLSSKSFNEGYDKAIETAKRVYEKV